MADQAWVMVDEKILLQPIDEVTTVQNYPVGFCVKAVHQTYKLGEFIYLPGVASVATGSAVVYDAYNGAVVRTVTTSRGPVGLAMGAIVASSYGWFQIFGLGVALGSTSDTADKPMFMTATDGVLEDSGGAGTKVDGCVSQTALDTPSTGKIVVALNYPTANGNG